MDIREHYRKNHHNKPHEYAANPIIPSRQQKEVEKDHLAHAFLYTAIGVGVILFLLIWFGIWKDARKHKKKDKKDKDEGPPYSKAPFHLPSSTKSSTSSNFSGKTTSTAEECYAHKQGGKDHMGPRTSPKMETKAQEVQPPTDHHVMAMSYEYEEDPFHVHNHHHRVSTASSSNSDLTAQPVRRQYPDLTQHKVQLQADNESAFSQSSVETVIERSISPGDKAKDKRSFSLTRQESFPFEAYGMPPEDREPRKTRVENMRPLSNYFQLTTNPSFLESMDEGEGEEIIGPFQGASTSLKELSPPKEEEEFENMKTLPLKDKHNNV